MPMYAIATIPLIWRISNSVTQVWYADDAAALGSVTELRNWWDNLVKLGPDFGYFANSTKTWLVTKDSCLSSATAAFAGTNVNITSSGRPYLGAPLGSSEYSIQFSHDKVEHWSNELKTLSEIATTQPHAALASYPGSFRGEPGYEATCCLCCLHSWFLQQMVPSFLYHAKHEQPVSTSGEHFTHCFIPTILEDRLPMTQTGMSLPCSQD